MVRPGFGIEAGRAAPAGVPGLPTASMSIARSWLERSRAHWDRGDADGALACCRSALALEPDNVDALAAIGTLTWLQGDSAAAEAIWLRALALDPRHAGLALNMATLRNENGDLEASLAWVARAEAVRPRDPEVVWRKSLLQLAMGDYTSGWQNHEAGLGQPAIRGPAPGFRTPAWRGEPCGRLLIWHEQGLGDSLQFVRYAELCKQRVQRVQVLCPAELVSILKSCPFVDDASESVGVGDFDRHVSMMSLPHVFGTSLSTVPARIPYLFADPARSARWAARIATPGLAVGLVWSGKVRTSQLRFRILDRSRSMSFADLAPLLSTPGVAFYSLQKGPAAAEARTGAMPDTCVGAAKSSTVMDLMDEVHDFADTAAIIEHLDLVISVDTSVVHLAGAMGKPVWVMSRLDACWRWLRNQPTSPWYPTARVFGQSVRGDWTGVVAQVAAELAALARTQGTP